MKKLITLKALLVVTPFLMIDCKDQQEAPELTIKADLIENHIKILSDDSFLGRQPGTIGEPITTKYIEDQFKKIGIKPANGDSYFQEFEITEIAPVPPKTFTINTSRGKNISFKIKEDFIAVTSKVDELVSIEDKELVFAGFGIVAPEYNWDDYQDLDVKGKVVMVLYNDPGLYTKDDNLFQGLTPSKYSSANYKKQEALKHGAIGVLTIFHDTGLAGLNWGLVQAMATRPTYYLKGNEPPAQDNLLFSGIVSVEMANIIFKESGYDFDYLKKALSKDFKPISLSTTGSVEVKSVKRTFKTNNVIGILEGSKTPDETIIYTAHWDHDGYIKNSKEKDSIYNGAIDNATGVAMVLETARAYKNLKNRPDRSIVFFLTSAEEMGLLGSNYYASHPLFPLSKTVCVINSDASFATEPMRVALNVVKGYSDDMDKYVDSAAVTLGREIIIDPTPETGAFYRSDHYPLVEKGVPAVWAVGGAEPMAGDSIQQMKIIEDYLKRYHQLNDEYYEGFIARNIAFDAQMNFLIGYYLSNSRDWPNWNEDIPYKKVRDESKSSR